MGISENRLFNTLLYTVGLILAAIIMTGSVFLIYNSFNISLNERIRQFGILSSVGATSKQLLNSVLFEGLCIGAAGTPDLIGIRSRHCGGSRAQPGYHLDFSIYSGQKSLKHSRHGMYPPDK